jgi:hypothetical protein
MKGGEWRWVGLGKAQTAGNKRVARPNIGVCRGRGVEGKGYQVSKDPVTSDMSFL